MSRKSLAGVILDVKRCLRVISKVRSAAGNDSRWAGEGRACARARFGTFSIFLISVCILLGGCQPANKSMIHAGPVIEFTSVPVAGADNPEKLSSIRGLVTRAEPGQQIVLYAKGETTWWVQPLANQPFTKIEANSTWRNSTHPGAQYAALLVGPTFRPPLTADMLPTEGVFATAITKGELPFWRKWWFALACVIGGVLAVFGFHRLRLYQLTRKMNLRFEERLAERMRVAQELHDTLLQGVISASMQLHVAVDQLPADSPLQPALRRILQLMGQVIEEGRNTLQGLRSSSEGADDVERAFLRIRQELGIDERVDFHLVVEGSRLPMRALIRDEVYSIGREALVNAFRHSGGSSVEVELEYAADLMRVSVRDNGCGIDPEVLRSGRDGHWGLSGMRERAEKMGARFRVLSGASAGTEIELSVPGHIAFESPSPNRRWRWLPKLHVRGGREAKPDGERVG
jgi:signal transduction histidine kinase